MRAQELPPRLPPDHPGARSLSFSDNAAAVTHARYEAGSTCANCRFYRARADEADGTCPLFRGYRVPTGGWCSAWSGAGAVRNSRRTRR